MARMLDALERARQERLRQLQQGEGSAASAAPAPAQSASDDAKGGSAAPAPPVTAPAATAARPAEAPSRSVTYHHEIDEQVVGVHDVQSPVTEQLRLIRTNLETVLADYRARSIVISSPCAGDGKSLVAANLAAVLADDPKSRVVLVDADLRGPVQHRNFGLRGTPGLAEYLQGRAGLEQVVRETSLPNLNVIPAGHPPAKPAVLLGSERMQSLLAELQHGWQWIIMDTPPLLPVNDAAVLGRESVGMIMVLRMGRTPRGLIQRAQDMLAEMRLPVLGCILNDFDSPGSSNQYYYQEYRKAARDGFRS